MMLHKNILEISETKSHDLIEILDYWHSFTEITVLLIIFELRRRNVILSEETQKKILEFSFEKEKSISELEDEFLKDKEVESYDEYYDFKVKFLDKNSGERLRLNKVKIERSMHENQNNKKQAKRDLLYGGLWLGGGLLVTFITINSEYGGIVAYGAIIFGGIQFVRGLTNII